MPIKEFAPTIPGAREGRDYEPDRRELKANPGQWGMLDEMFPDSTKAGSFAQALAKPHGFRAKTRKVGDEQFAVWGRWTAEDEAADIEAAQVKAEEARQAAEAQAAQDAEAVEA